MNKINTSQSATPTAATRHILHFNFSPVDRIIKVYNSIVLQSWRSGRKAKSCIVRIKTDDEALRYFKYTGRDSYAKPSIFLFINLKRWRHLDLCLWPCGFPSWSIVFVSPMILGTLTRKLVAVYYWLQVASLWRAAAMHLSSSALRVGFTP